MKQQTKTFLGWLVILLIIFSPVYFLFHLGEGSSEFYNYATSTHTLGEIFGLMAITMMALTFVLSTRIKKIEDVFGGLDKVYIVHGVLGGSALILALSHPIFLVLNKVQTNVALAAKYLLPGSYWSVNFGIIALTGLLILIYITLFTKMKYHKWKFTHEFMGAVFIFAVLHMFLVRGTASLDYIFKGYYAFATIVAVVGLSAFSYSLFLKNRLVKNAVYIVKNIQRKNENFIMELEPQHKPISYKAGQFVFLRFYNNRVLREAHPFSIASKTNKSNIRIVIKRLGDYTSKIDNIQIGDKVSLEGPYGRFNFRNFEKKDQIWIAAGIGITPFMGMVEDLAEKDHDVNVDLFYSFKDSSDFIIDDLFNSGTIRNFKFIPWNSSQRGYIKAKDIARISEHLSNKEILICGPPRFKEKIIKDLVELGVKKSNIHEEVFDFR